MQMQDYKNRLQALQAQSAELTCGEIIKEFLGAVCVFALPILLLFIGTMLGF